MKVDILADKIPSKKSSFLVAIFKKALKKRLNCIKNGRITVKEGSEVMLFGELSSKNKVVVNIHSDEFYIFAGSGGSVGIAEAYVLGHWSSDNVVLLMRIFLKNRETLLNLEKGFAKFLNPINRMIHRKRKNTVLGSKKNIVAHYDLSNDFYKTWLDSTMTYSCGYFKDDSVTLKDASLEKLDRMCRKLKLSEDDSILEIGTGWGSFAMHAVKNYGCAVTTTTISDAQYEYAYSSFKKEGLESKIKLVNKDYRELSGLYDKIVSIEMIEAVGHEFIPTFFKKISSLLKPNGMIGIQGITYNDHDFDRYKNSVDFIKKYIFPGSCLISVAQIVDVLKNKTDLSIVHMEDITRHYPKTLSRWRENFLEVINEIKKMGYSHSFIKMWEFYLMFCEAGFIERNIGDVQLIFAKADARDIEIKY